MHSWTSAHLKPWTAQDVITLCSSHSCLTDPNSFVLRKTLGSGAQFSVWLRSILVIDGWTPFWSETMTLFSGLGTDVHFSGDGTGLQWEDNLFEMQNAVGWRMVMSRGQDERSQVHAVSLLLSTCDGMTNRVLIDEGAKWILQGVRARTREPNSWCQSSPQRAGGPNLWSCEGARETRTE